MRSWISSGAGQRRPRSAPGGSLSGSTSPPANSTTGGNATGRRTSTTAGFPRDFWLEEWEKQAIIGFHLKNPLEGYRRRTFMMLDADIVAVSPSSVWRVLSQAGLLSK